VGRRISECRPGRSDPAPAIRTPYRTSGCVLGP
jgi:hypothetical protein